MRQATDTRCGRRLLHQILCWGLPLGPRTADTDCPPRDYASIAAQQYLVLDPRGDPLDHPLKRYGIAGRNHEAIAPRELPDKRNAFRSQGSGQGLRADRRKKATVVVSRNSVIRADVLMGDVVAAAPIGFEERFLADWRMRLVAEASRMEAASFSGPVRFLADEAGWRADRAERQVKLARQRSAEALAQLGRDEQQIEELQRGRGDRCLRNAQARGPLATRATSLF